MAGWMYVTSSSPEVFGGFVLRQPWILKGIKRRDGRDGKGGGLGKDMKRTPMATRSELIIFAFSNLAWSLLIKS